jgi:4-amino-4-deoxy-L-arabinose transferase-like glycosyltransferase
VATAGHPNRPNDPGTLSDLQWTLLLFAGAFLVRTLDALGSAIFGTDACHYLLMADWMRAGRFHDALSVAYHPLYPLLIAVATSVTGSAESAGHAVSVLLGSAAIVPLYRLVLAVFGRPAAAITSLLYAFAPWMVEVQSEVMTEGTFIFFLFSSAWLTWRMLEEPSVIRGAVLGGAAAAAFLTRPEGLLAIALALAWPAAGLVLGRGPRWKVLAGIACTLVVVGLVLSPYLLWVRSVRGHWALSVRPSAMSFEQAVGAGGGGEPTAEYAGSAALYRIYFVSLFKLSAYGTLIPFYVLGVRALLKASPRVPLVFFLSYPLGLLGGVLFTLRTHTFMAERYLLAGMGLLSAVAALGLAESLGRLIRARPESRLRPILCGAAALVAIGLPIAKSMKVRRQELLSYPAAARWILARTPRPTCVVGLEQVSYYCGTRSYYLPGDRKQLSALLDRERVDYIVYSEKDLTRKPEFVATVRSLDGLESAEEIQGPPGTWKVYVHHWR